MRKCRNSEFEMENESNVREETVDDVEVDITRKVNGIDSNDKEYEYKK